MPNGIERRRSPRVSAANHPDLPTGLVDVSLDGLSLRLHKRLARGSVHDIGLTLRSGSEMILRVRVAYSHREPAINGRASFLTGLAFLDDVTHRANTHPLRLAC